MSSTVTQTSPASIAADFKHAMRRLATTVSIITTSDGDCGRGIVATAVVPICAEPPTMMVAINRSASIYATMRDAEHFCINLLAPRHLDLVAVFSGSLKCVDRFAEGHWREGVGGIPVLVDSLAGLLCKRAQTVDVGTHSLFFGEVAEIVNHADIDPLMWMDGGPVAGPTKLSAWLA